MTILLIDDNQEDSATLVRNAKLKNIEIIYKQNYEAGFKELRNNPTIKGLIFDAKCWRTQQEEDDEVEPSDEALSEALELLEEYEKQTNNYFPLVINTGYSFPTQYFQPRLRAFQAKIFEKGRTNPDDIFNYLKEKIENSLLFKIERQFTDVLELFDTQNKHLRQNFIAIFIDLEKQETNKATLVHIRNVYEGIVKNNLSSLANTGDAEIYPLRDAIWKTSSHYLHPNNKQLPTYYLIKGLAYLLVEVLLWYKQTPKK